MSKDSIKPGRGMSRGVKTIFIVLGFFVLTAGATAVEMALKSRQHRPLLGNVVALALLNINVLLLAVLLLLLGRQVVKFYFERKRSPFGTGFRSKLIAAFVGLSIVPAGILFIVATGMLTGGVKFWFGPRVESTVRDSVALARGYEDDRKNTAQRFADSAAGRFSGLHGGVKALDKAATTARALFGLDMVEVYDARGSLLAVAGGRGPRPMAGREFAKRALRARRLSEVSSTRRGKVIRGAAVFYDRDGAAAGVVVADYLPSPGVSGNISRIDRFYREYWGLRTFKNPLKESYLLSFMLVTLVIVFAALWFGLYMSKGITGPIITLAEATHRISRGEYDFPADIEATDEIGVLVDSFKRMTRDLKSSKEKLEEANLSLRKSNALLEQRRRFIETVLENVNAGVITIDRAGRISTVNRAAERILALDPDEIVSRGYREVFSFHQLDGLREEIRAMVDGGRESIERDVRLQVKRRSLNLRLFMSTLHGMDGGYLGILVVFDDMTELIKAQRAAAWKEVARRIAHEVKNPLTPIQLSAQRLRKRFLEGTGGYESIIGECTETIITQVEGMKALVDEFSKFARMPEAVPAPNDLHAIIDEAAALYTGAHKDLVINRDYAPDMPEVSVDAGQMKRVFMNLLDNAVTAMEGRGSVWIKTELDAQTGMARVEVADEGVGVLPEDRERLFQPYFSKKKSGTGLGLAIVGRIISDHGGYIHAEGNSPKGAKFIIELPAGG